MATTQEIISKLELGSKEHDYIVDCLKSAISYCKEQYISSSIDWLPTVRFVGLDSEIDKFELAMEYIKTLEA